MSIAEQRLIVDGRAWRCPGVPDIAITSNQAQTAITWPMFVQRVQLQLCITALAVYGEPNNTPGHPARAARATAVLNNTSQYVLSYAQVVVAQINLSNTNIVNNNTDLDTTDAAIAAAISAKWNALAGA